jgi:DNA segregation ATPase FtsK/SpoIIIE, S-DNA-T family
MTLPDNVHHLRLPGRAGLVPVDDEPDRPGTELEPATEVLEGELVDEPAPAVARPAPSIPVWSRRLPAPVQRAAASPVAGHAYVTVAGAGSWATRAWDSATLGTYRRQIRAAEATGDSAGLALWLERREEAAGKRHARLLAAPRVVGALFGAAVVGVLGLAFLIVAVGVLASVTGVASFGGLVGGVLTAVGWLLRIALVAAVLALVAGPVALVVMAWREGRRAGRAPTWMATATDANDVDIEVDETTIARALDALRIPQIRDYLKAGTPLQFIVTARKDGRGTHAVLRLPAGVTAEQIAKRRAQLATGLYRQAKEVWPTTGTEAGIVDLWVADKGALAEGAGPYPLLTDGVVDVFKGVPFGKLLRGDPIVEPVMERNTIVGGQPGQGKSAAARIIMTGAALDPTAELRIWVPDSNFDFEVFRPRCSRYVMGAEDEFVERILFDLRELYAEVQHRGQILIANETPAVTRRLASAGVGLHPLFCLLEEAHLCIQHKEFGPEISQLLVDIVRLGRKRGIHMIVSTQAPTKASMPRDVTRNCTNGIAFAVGDYVANDALLGQGAYSAGHRATELIPGVDRGTAVVKGFSGERSEIVQVYFLDVEKGRDQVSPIIARSVAAIEASGRSVPRPGPMEQRDLLTDVAAVLDGDEPLPVAEIPPRLRRLAPGWGAYRTLTGKALRAHLDDVHGYRVPSTGNRYPVDPGAIRALLADREAEGTGSE